MNSDFSFLFCFSGGDHVEEYQSLCVRCEAVSAEMDDIGEHLRAIDQNVQDEEQQVENISAAQEKIQTEIRNLQARICDALA